MTNWGPLTKEALRPQWLQGLSDGTALCRYTKSSPSERNKKASIRWQNSAPLVSGYWPTS